MRRVARPDICEQRKFRALQETQGAPTRDECAVARGWVCEHENTQCRNAPAPQATACRTVFATITSTIAEDDR